VVGSAEDWNLNMDCARVTIIGHQQELMFGVITSGNNYLVRRSKIIF